MIRPESAPFDHSSLCVPDGHPGGPTHVTNDRDNPGQATDQYRCLPAVGTGGARAGVRTFTAALGLNQTDR